MKGLIPVLTHDGLAKHCPEIDVSFLAREPVALTMKNMLHRYESGSTLRLVKNMTDDYFRENGPRSLNVIKPSQFLNKTDVRNMQVSKTAFDEIQLSFELDREVINKIYGHPGACALWISPYRNIIWNKFIKQSQKSEKQELVRDLIKYTRRPFSVITTAKKFLESMNCKKIGTIHWRYDHYNYAKGCENGSAEHRNSVACQILNDGFDVEKISNRISLWAESQNITCVYFATPSSDINFVDELTQNWMQTQIKLFHQIELAKMIDRIFSSCDKTTFSNQIHDFISQVEQEICFQSDVFLSSSGSSWSLAVTQERTVFERVTFDDSNEILLK